MINTAKEIDDALSEISHDDPALAAQLKKLTECAVAVGSGDEDVAMKNFSQFASMFKDTLSQLSAQAGDGQDDLMDDDLTSIMSSLDKLGISDPPCGIRVKNLSNNIYRMFGNFDSPVSTKS